VTKELQHRHVVNFGDEIRRDAGVCAPLRDMASQQ